MIDRGPGGECLRCLVEFVFSPVGGDAWLGPEGDRSPSGRQPWRYGHFEILAGADGRPVELGSGAMGITYRAHDTVLHTAVALKIIRRDLAASAEAHARFLREARAAARLRHPNVASVFHYGEQDDECFYAMELVEGETLEERVQRQGPLPVAMALEIALQVTRALAAAEAYTMVHRDLKPSNIMLAADKTPAGEDTFTVKVIDFGLASAITVEGEAAGGSRHPEDFAGTPAFASPEQFAGDPSRPIDTRSDIYSLGVTLWYLLSAALPFPEGTLSEITARRGFGPSSLPFERLKAARVPYRCVRLLRSMLAVDPALRPQTACELHDALRRCQVRRVRLSLVGGLAVLCLLAAGIAAWRFQPAVRMPSADRSVAVLPFDNLASESSDGFFAAGMRDEIIGDLTHVADLKIVGAESARSYDSGNRDPARISRELGVRYILGGSVRRTQERVYVKVWLTDTSQTTKPWATQYDRSLAGVFAVQGEIARAVADRLDARLTPREIKEIGRPPTGDLVAYDLYLRALEMEKSVFKTQLEVYQNYAKMVPLLEQAIARDSDFALAYCELATAQDNLYYEQAVASREERAIDHRGKADAALAQARRLRPEIGELNLAQATHFLRTGLESEQARIEIDLARETLPNNARVEELAGEIARQSNHWEEAIRYLERAVMLEPREEVSRYTLANTYRLLRRYDEARNQLDRLIAIMPDNESYSFRLTRELYTLEQGADIVRCRRAVDELCRQHPEADVTRVYHLLLALNAHDVDELTRILATATRPRFLISRVPYPKAWFEGLAARMLGDQSGAQAAFLAARTDLEKAVQNNAGDGRMLGLLAMIDAGLGNKDAAVSEAQHACELCSQERLSTRAPAVAMNLAVVYAWTDQPALACQVISQWIERPAGMELPAQPTYGDLQLNPVWDPIRGRPEFIALTARLAPPPAP